MRVDFTGTTTSSTSKYYIGSILIREDGTQAQGARHTFIKEECSLGNFEPLPSHSGY